MTFRFVPHHLVKAYLALGWCDCGFAPGHHGAHARVMKWEGEGEPVEPEREAA